MSAFMPRALLAAALALAGPALAQRGPPPGPEPDIVVTGELDRDQQVRDFVAALTPAPANGQLSRFEDAICPAAFGLSGALRDAVVQRIRAVSAAAGLRLASGRCTPNVLLMVTNDKRVLIDALARRHPDFFSDEPEGQPRRIASEPGPAAAWDARAQLNADGQQLPMQDGVAINRTTNPGSRISASGRVVVIAAVVVVERRALEGLSTVQLADYALMRALGRTDPHRLTGASPPSILGVLEAPMGSEVPVSLTRWDLGFLRGLYAGQANLYAPAQRGEIGRRVASEVGQEGGPRQ